MLVYSENNMGADPIGQCVVRMYVKTVLRIWFEGITSKLSFVEIVPFRTHCLTCIKYYIYWELCTEIDIQRVRIGTSLFFILGHLSITTFGMLGFAWNSVSRVRGLCRISHYDR